MSERVLSDQPEELSFSRAFFGYDPLEVQSRIAELNRRLEQQGVDRDHQPEEGGAANDYDLAVAIDTAVSHVAEVLEAARAAAQKIRDQAGHDAEDSLAAAVEQARKLMAAAGSEAYALRKAAWEASTELLSSADAEYAKKRSAAERKSLEIINNAERNAHRKLAVARRDSENALQAAASEADQVLEAARIKGQEIIRTAENRAEMTEEQSQVLERRRRELAEEIEELESRLEGPPVGSVQAAPPPASVRVIHPDEARAPEENHPDFRVEAAPPPAPAPSPASSAAGPRSIGWADGTETVRLLGASASRAGVEAAAPDPADEAARLNDSGARSVAAPETRTDPSERAAGNGPPAGRRPGTPEAAGTTRSAPAPSSRPTPRSKPTAVRPAVASAPARAAVRTGSRKPDELGDLFLALRTKKASGSSASASPPGPPDPMPPDPMLSAAERYDRLLLPVVNRALRAVKRQLTDIQGEQIEALKAGADSPQPPPSGLASSLLHLISVMEREAAELGFTSAAEMTGAGLEAACGEVPAEGRESFPAALFEDAAMGVRAARNAGLSEKELAAAAARVYRTWRIDEAERRLRFLAGRAYHHGLMSGLAEAGVGEYRIEVNGGCGECGALAEGVMARDQVPMVPVHSECRCLVIPA